jgi:hypothetical protein
MKHILQPAVLVVAVLALTVSLALAQNSPTPPAAPATPGGLGTKEAPPPRASNLPDEKVIDGPVKNVDAAAKTVQVGWFLGLLSTELEVTDDTHIAVEGAKGSLQMIREGDRVKASYEARDGKNIAKSIEVTQAERADATPSRAPTQQPASPPMQSPQSSTEQSSGGSPKTP